MKPTLLVLAAGMGSRYGGLKQIDPVGPNGEAILDYSVYDALKAGFGKVVFVIRKSFEDAFKEKIGSKLKDKTEVVYVHQELDSGLGGFEVPENRQKPWGTGHAILVAKKVINEPFAVINADDFYGFESYKLMKGFLSDDARQDLYSMVGFYLRNTLSEHGHVSRGVCEVTKDMFLEKVTERTKIFPKDGKIVYVSKDDQEISIEPETLVSMNLWGFHPSIFKHLQKQFEDFLINHAREEKSEFYIPFVVDNLIRNKAVSVKVLSTDSKWFGVTYSDDKASAQQTIEKMINEGKYPQDLQF